MNTLGPNAVRKPVLPGALTMVPEIGIECRRARACRPLGRRVPRAATARHDEAAAVLQPAPGCRRSGHDLPIERIAGLDRFDLDQTAAGRARDVSHRREAGDPRQPGPRRRRACRALLGRWLNGRRLVRATSAPRSDWAWRRTESRRLSANEAIATSAATPIATEPTSGSRRRGAARSSRAAMRSAKPIGVTRRCRRRAGRLPAVRSDALDRRDRDRA